MSNAEMGLLIIAVVSGALYTWFILTFTQGWMLLEQFNLKEDLSTFISVIIPVRNEAKNLERLQHHLKAQQYPDKLHEFIFVNDHSTDGTKDVLENIPGIKVLCLPDGSSGKKAALTYGIEYASGSLISTLDADCLPGPKWLASIATYYEEGRYKMIAGPVAIQNPRGFFSSFEALELLSLVASGGGAIGIRRPIMCNGANLTYEKNVFKEVEGFRGNEHIAGGDDIFMMEKINRHYPKGSIGFIKNAEGMIYTPASPGLKAFLNQRFRWVAKSPSYKDRFLIASAITVLGFNLVLLMSLIWAFFSLHILWVFIGLFTLKCLVDFPILRSASKFAGQQHLMASYIPFQFIYFIFISLSGLLGNLLSYSWKGRQN